MVAGEACGQPDGMLVKRPCSVGARSAPEDKGAERSERRIPRALRARNAQTEVTVSEPAAGEEYGAPPCCVPGMTGDSEVML